jgi:hypothetical protein
VKARGKAICGDMGHDFIYLFGQGLPFFDRCLSFKFEVSFQHSIDERLAFDEIVLQYLVELPSRTFVVLFQAHQ